jgi:succinate dehydrogenase hydrophobic anchor subunit
VRESRLWALHLLSGAALLVLLALHMGLMHYESIWHVLGWMRAPVLGFASVAARDRDAVMRTLYVLLLGFALYHGLYGARGILQEVWTTRRAAQVINIAMIAIGVAGFVYGAAVIWLAGRAAGG